MTSTTSSYMNRPPVHKFVIAQLFVTVVISILGSLVSVIHGYSALLGGLICTLPNGYFVYRTFVYRGARAAANIVKSFYKAEASKFVLTALLFGLAFKFVHPIEPVSLFLAFFLVQTVHWLTPILMQRSIKTN